jgi:nitrous oxide reductase accessory protein NosL
MLKIVIPLLVIISLLHADIYKRGEKVFASVCDSQKLKNLTYDDKDMLKKMIIDQKLCTDLNEKNLKALVAYMSRDSDTKSKTAIKVPPKAKCPVCGMWVSKYPKWVAVIKVDKDMLYFDGVKDMMKFYFDPARFHHKKSSFDTIKVTDYYSLKPIIAQKAHYVIGSNIYGPMGEELIPFAKLSDAKAFKKDHDGKSILTFDDIEEKFLY